ncbi:chemotaxis protein CheB [Acanthopleuribacter pedis]|uniref:protein-glutamate methylesterase n=1 Tax=Acanthopleuribacter pedis TaxID=442870 RepID=A0A8J7QFR8_9BACT|nr:chemotaxis protein CheB [Acanthopleuribacter pedis]MBO1321585.1 chemotaxis protein CheB [Acanthopleuribacter pedis]
MTSSAVQRRFECLVIGVSAGGMDTLSLILPHWTKDFPIPIVAVQHVGADSGRLIYPLLQQKTSLRIKEAEEKEQLRAGHLYLAPAGYHLLIEADNSLSLSVDARVNYARPSIDVLFESAAEVYGPRLIGVILTGANHDGSQGLRMVAELGGFTVVQSPESAEVAQMPLAALNATTVDRVLAPTQIATLLSQMAEGLGEVSPEPC